MNIQKKLQTIQRRIDHLEDRIDKADFPLTYDVSEAEALRWIVGEYKYFKELRDAAGRKASIYDSEAHSNRN